LFTKVTKIKDDMVLRDLMGGRNRVESAETVGKPLIELKQLAAVRRPSSLPAAESKEIGSTLETWSIRVKTG